MAVSRVSNDPNLCSWQYTHVCTDAVIFSRGAKVAYCTEPITTRGLPDICLILRQAALTGSICLTSCQEPDILHHIFSAIVAQHALMSLEACTAGIYAFRLKVTVVYY